MSNNCQASFNLISSRINHKRRRFKCRLSYITEIVERLWLTKKLLPEPNEEQLYQEALGHLVHVLSTRRSPVIHQGYMHNSCTNDSCAKQGLNKREEKMEEILNKLKYLERRRLYDPPSDNEIGYYHLIKKYIRSMALYFNSRKGLDEHVNERFDCVTTMQELHYLEELEEVNRNLEQFSAYLTNMEVINGCDLKQHLLGITEVRVPEEICGSKEGNNMFYHHKFKLALLDLVSSHYAFSHPCPEEKSCYEQILILPPAPPHPTIREVSVYSDHLRYQFLIKVVGKTSNLKKHFAHVGTYILAKLSISISWENLESLCPEHGGDQEEDEGLLSFIKESLDKCDIRESTQLLDYVQDVDRCIQIAHYIWQFISGLGHLNENISPDLHISFHPNDTSARYWANMDWQSFHAFTLFKNDSSFPVNEVGEDMLQNALQPCNKRENQAALSERKGEDENENVEMLKAILEEIRMIGDWSLEPLPTCKEDHILLNICRCVTSSTHFFFSATAYEQRTHVIHHGGPNVRRTGRKRKIDDLDLSRSYSHICQLWGAFVFMLEGYKDGLLHKLKNLQ